MAIIHCVRYASDHKHETRERILAEAAKQIRSHGPLGIGVAEIMKRAGLTHGGFYAHFESKDALLTAAISKMFEDALSRWHSSTEGRTASDGLSAYVDWYLSPQHRDARETGCPMAALSSDLPRLPSECRTAFADGVRSLAERLAYGLRELRLRKVDPLAASVLAELVGALSIARVEPDQARSDAILTASRRAIRARLGLGAARRGRAESQLARNRSRPIRRTTGQV